MEDIKDADYANVNSVKICKDSEIKNLGEYHNLYVPSDTLFLVDVFEKFRNMYLKIYKPDLVKKFSVPALACKQL